MLNICEHCLQSGHIDATRTQRNACPYDMPEPKLWTQRYNAVWPQILALKRLRCVGATNEADPKERTPVFAQWLTADTVSRAGHPPPGRAALMPPPPARER